MSFLVVSNSVHLCLVHSQQFITVLSKTRLLFAREHWNDSSWSSFKEIIYKILFKSSSLPASASSFTFTSIHFSSPLRDSRLSRLGKALPVSRAPPTPQRRPTLSVGVRWRGGTLIVAAVDCDVRAQQPGREPAWRSQILRGLRRGWERGPGQLRQHEDRHGAVRGWPGGRLGEGGSWALAFFLILLHFLLNKEQSSAVITGWEIIDGRETICQ